MASETVRTFFYVLNVFSTVKNDFLRFTFFESSFKAALQSVQSYSEVGANIHLPSDTWSSAS